LDRVSDGYEGDLFEERLLVLIFICSLWVHCMEVVGETHEEEPFWEEAFVLWEIGGKEGEC